MGKEIDFQVRLQLNRAADEFVKDDTKSADRAEDRFLVAFKCDGALDPEGRIIVSWRDGVREFEEMRRSAERINLVQSFTENILLVPSDELRARMNDSDELRAWLLDGLCQFFDSSKIDENFLVGQAWKAEKWLPVDDDFFRFKAYQLLRNQDQPQQTAVPAGDQATKKDTPIIEAVKSWEPGKARPKIFYTEIDKIKKRLGVGTDQAINSFCSEYGFSGQEKAFEKSYECHCKKLVKKRKDRTTINPR